MTSTSTADLSALKALRAQYQAAGDLMISTRKTLDEASALNDRLLRNSRVAEKRKAASIAMLDALTANDAAVEAFREVEGELQQAEGSRIMAEKAAAPRFFIAVPGDDQGVGIFGIGLSDDAAIQDVAARSGWREPTVTQDEDGHWVVSTDTGEDKEFIDEGDARGYAAEKGFVALECTERMYEAVKNGEVTRWTTNAAGLQDLDIDASDLAGALAEVNEGLAGVDDGARAEWKAEDALSDAHEYVDAYIGEDEDSEYYVMINDFEFRTALDLAVRDSILEDIAERDAD